MKAVEFLEDVEDGDDGVAKEEIWPVEHLVKAERRIARGAML